FVNGEIYLIPTEMQNLIKGTSLDKAQAAINQGWRNRGRQVQARGHEVPLREHVSAKSAPTDIASSSAPCY
ncbi:hypothetical protein ACHWQZ_G013256, partial [Mnemiopsis leidyi]